jgi:hypothetical protein
VTVAEPEPCGLSTVVMFVGQVIWLGGVVSLMVTVKLHWAVLFDVSVTVQVTVVVPCGNTVPEAGVQTTDCTAQLSLPAGVA